MSKAAAAKATTTAAPQAAQTAAPVAADPAHAGPAMAAVPASWVDLVPGTRDKVAVRPFGELTMMLFGEPKSGKTKFCAGNPGAFFLATEPGQEFVQARQLYLCQELVERLQAANTNPSVQIKYHWQAFQAFVRQVYKDKRDGTLAKKQITNVVIDIVDNLYAHCLNYVCGIKGIAYPPENDFGKTWKECRDEWETWLRRLMEQVNVTFITHCGQEKVELQAAGITKEVTRWQPTFKGNKAAQYLDGVVNAIGHVRKDANGRYTISFKGQPSTAAGDRTGLLEALGDVDLQWSAVEAGYTAKAKELGLEVQSRWA
jgi:hypothetical protein